MTERETLLAEIAERQARLAEIDAEFDYEAWRPALEAYLAVDDIAAKPSTPLDSWDRQCIRGLIAAFAKAPPMGSIEPVVSRGIGLSGKVEEVIVDGVRYVLPTRADFEALEAMREAREALVTAEKVFATYANLHRAKNTKEGNQKAATNTGYSLDMGEAAETLTAAIAKIEGEQP